MNYEDLFVLHIPRYMKTVLVNVVYSQLGRIPFACIQVSSVGLYSLGVPVT